MTRPQSTSILGQKMQEAFEDSDDVLLNLGNIEINVEYDNRYGSPKEQTPSLQAQTIQPPQIASKNAAGASSTWADSCLSHAGTQPPKSINKPWSNLFANGKSELQLQYIDPGEAKNTNKLFLPRKVAAQNTSSWAATMIGYFLRGRPSFPLVHTTSFRMWGKFGLKEVMVNEEGFFFFKFDTKEHRDKVVEGGPWTISEQPIFLRKWNTNLQLRKEDQERIPIWVKIYNLPLEYWCKEGLQRVASMLGTPLCMDTMTENCKRISYARICVDMSINSEFKSAFDIEVENDDGSLGTITLHLEYQWKPSKCTICKSFLDCNWSKQPAPFTKPAGLRPMPPKKKRFEWVIAKGKNPLKESSTKAPIDDNVFKVLESIKDMPIDEVPGTSTNGEGKVTNSITKGDAHGLVDLMQDTPSDTNFRHLVASEDEDEDSDGFEGEEQNDDFVAYASSSCQQKPDQSVTKKKKKSKKKSKRRY